MHLKSTNWIIITGSSCSGKTSLLNHLGFLGYRIYPEVSRVYCENLKSKGLSIEEIRRSETFESDLIIKKAELENRTDTRKQVFFDRSIIDSFAFANIYNTKIQDLKSFINFQYKMVFYLDRLPYTNDPLRFEDDGQLDRLENAILEAYNQHGYVIHRIPKTSIENRANLIINQINHAYKH